MSLLFSFILSEMRTFSTNYRKNPFMVAYPGSRVSFVITEYEPVTYAEDKVLAKKTNPPTRFKAMKDIYP